MHIKLFHLTDLMERLGSSFVCNGSFGMIFMDVQV